MLVGKAIFGGTDPCVITEPSGADLIPSALAKRSSVIGPILDGSLPTASSTIVQMIAHLGAFLLITQYFGHADLESRLLVVTVELPQRTR
jgi:hypothetical protein